MEIRSKRKVANEDVSGTTMDQLWTECQGKGCRRFESLADDSKRYYREMAAYKDKKCVEVEGANEDNHQPNFGLKR